MKVFRLNTYFSLPDDFEGTFDDALKLWLEHRDAETDIPGSAFVSCRVAHEAFSLNLRYGVRCVAETGVWQLKHPYWERLDKNPDTCYSSGDTWIK